VQGGAGGVTYQEATYSGGTDQADPIGGTASTALTYTPADFAAVLDAAVAGPDAFTAEDALMALPDEQPCPLDGIPYVQLAWEVTSLGGSFAYYEIDRLGIHVVNIQAMRRALAALRPAPSFVLSDGFAVPGLPVPALGVPKGDRVAACVAAASVVAKVTRDRMMCELELRHPGYGFDRHKGYNAPDHLAALDELGPCPEHRQSWITVRIRQPGALGGPPSSPAPPRVVQTVPMDCEQVEDR
jgi:ribonuclease HII